MTTDDCSDSDDSDSVKHPALCNDHRFESYFRFNQSRLQTRHIVSRQTMALLVDEKNTYYWNAVDGRRR